MLSVICAESAVTNSRSVMSFERFAPRSTFFTPPVPHMLDRPHTMPFTQSARPNMSIPSSLFSQRSVGT